MSRSGFHEMEDLDQDSILASGRTQGRIASATRGARGQKFLQLALAALDGMEDKRLAGGTFGVGDGGCMCLMSSIAIETGRMSAFSGLAMDDGEGVCHSLASTFDLAPVMVQDLVWNNDENAPLDPAKRWQYMRNQIANSIKSTDSTKEGSAHEK
jgi:hypothetical protein